MKQHVTQKNLGFSEIISIKKINQKFKKKNQLVSVILSADFFIIYDNLCRVNKLLHNKKISLEIPLSKTKNTGKMKKIKVREDTKLSGIT